jgi:phosphoribosylformylglycinamidine synthase
MSEFRFAVNVMPKPGILDPQGRAVESSLGHLGIDGVSEVRVGRRVELTVAAVDETAARATVERLAGELLSNPLIEAFEIELRQATSSMVSPGPSARDEGDAASRTEPAASR